MRRHLPMRSGFRWVAASAGLAAGAYAAWVATAWYGYGRAKPPSNEESDSLLDLFMPVYDVRGRHAIGVAAPVNATMAAAREMELLRSPVVRAVIRAREVILGAMPDERPRPRGLLAETQAMGWGVLADVPDHEVVVGAVTRPWEANVVFRALPPDEFALFDEPGYVKIVWTLRADPLGPGESLFSTETRVAATDAAARAKFRLYWSCFSPGMILIRWLSLGPVRAAAERRARQLHSRRPASVG